MVSFPCIAIIAQIDRKRTKLENTKSARNFPIRLKNTLVHSSHDLGGSSSVSTLAVTISSLISLRISPEVAVVYDSLSVSDLALICIVVGFWKAGLAFDSLI